MKKTVIIAGTARSGLTLLTTILEAGGLPVEGEFPYVGHREGEIPWDKVKGKVVMVMDTHRQLPPSGGEYLVIKCKRSLRYQIESVNKFNQFMRIRPYDKKVLKIMIPRDNFIIDDWIKDEAIPKLTVSFEDMINNTDIQLARIALFLGETIDIPMAASAVMKRTHKCHPRMLEAELMQLHFDKKLNTAVEELEESGKEPPCLDCGAMTHAEAHMKCKVGQDGKTACHGFKLWPATGAATNG